MNNYILHVDGDNFFVACEVARFPHLKGKPVVVGEERGIACAMSIEAKKLGITRATPIFKIREMFRDTVAVLPAHFELYEQYNQNLYDILLKYTNIVERYSIDECFAVLTETQISEHRKRYGCELLETIKKDAETSLGITLSFGLAGTKTLAKIASKKEKPSGCVTLCGDLNSSDSNNLKEILKNTPIGAVWGIGRATSAKLTSYNVYTALDFIGQERQFIESKFGKHVLDTWYELRGQIRHEVESSRSRTDAQKSFQSTRSFGKSTKERSFLLSELCIHAEILCSRLRKARLTTNRFSFFIKKNSTYNRFISTEIDLNFYTNNPSDILNRIEKELDGMLLRHLSNGADNANVNFSLGFKATGISIYHLRPEEAVQDDLFAMQSTKDKQNGFLKAIDSIHSRFGENSIYLASSLESRKRRADANVARNTRNKFVYGLPFPYMGEVS